MDLEQWAPRNECICVVVAMTRFLLTCIVVAMLAADPSGVLRSGLGADLAGQIYGAPLPWLAIAINLTLSGSVLLLIWSIRNWKRGAGHVCKH